jgi:hypothetical protein
MYPFLAVKTIQLMRMLASFVDARARALFAVVCGAAAIGHGLLAAFFSWLTSRAGTHGTFFSLTGLPLQALVALCAAALMWPLLRKLDPANERPQAGMLR